MTVIANRNELATDRATVTPSVPVKSPTPPGAKAMGIKAKTVVAVEAPNGTQRCWIDCSMAVLICAPRLRLSL